MAIPATQIRRGMAIMFDGEPCRVIDFHHHTPGNLRAMVLSASTLRSRCQIGPGAGMLWVALWRASSPS